MAGEVDFVVVLETRDVEDVDREDDETIVDMEEEETVVDVALLEATTHPIS